MVKVFYNEKQSCTQANSYSPSAGKPALVVRDWIEKFGNEIEIQSFQEATRYDLYQAHDREYVDGVLDCREDNGFGNKNKAIAESLPYTTGSMIAAAEWVCDPKSRRDMPNIVFSPTSGFHHAGYSYGGGYCTFNGLMVTAIKMHKEKKADKILILDFDQHYGDGTQNIIDHLGLDYVTHITSGKSYNNAEQAFDVLGDLWGMGVRAYDLVMYQAGADSHVDDPLGGIFTTEQMLTRDIAVLDLCTMRCLPCIVTLAGGYKRDDAGSIEPVLALHRQTMGKLVERTKSHQSP
jgi:acetoin utilization deacetylase AcuC-like enzyme